MAERSADGFPVLETSSVLFRQFGCPTHVPWGLLEPHEDQAQQNHAQTLQRLAERGGLGVVEMYAVLNDLRYRVAEAQLGYLLDRSAATVKAITFIRRAIAEFNRPKTLRERDPEAFAALHSRNVDKQRRRLLALKCSHKARACDASAVAAQEGDYPYAEWCRNHAAKLRRWAARLREEKP